MAYQPIVRASSGEVYGHEALLRTREETMPGPQEVLEAAESLGALDDLGRAIREKRSARSWTVRTTAFCF